MSKIVYKFEAPKNKVNHLCVLISDTLKPQNTEAVIFKPGIGNENETFATIVAPSNVQVVCDLANIEGEICVHVFNEPETKIISPIDKMFAVITKNKNNKYVNDKEFLSQFGRLTFNVGDDSVYTLNDTTCYPIYHHCTNKSNLRINVLDEKSLLRRKSEMLDILKHAKANVTNAKLNNKLMMLINNFQTCKAGTAVQQLRNYTFFAEKGASVKVNSSYLPCFVACNNKTDLEVMAPAFVKLYVRNGAYQFVFDSLGENSDSANAVNTALSSINKKQAYTRFDMMLDYLARGLIFLEIVNETTLRINNDASSKSIAYYNNNINIGVVNKLQNRRQVKASAQDNKNGMRTTSVGKTTMKIQYQNTHQLLDGQLQALYHSWYQ